MKQTKEVVIDVQDGYKKYLGSDYILKGLNMAVPKGSIYSLLGPSGCGKTTLLSCIVGLQKLSSGFINMPSIKSPLDFSYMPQDLALEMYLTIEETFYLYGLMFGIEEEIVYKRLEYLSYLLHLPCKDSMVSTLSGGQQRRVSFAVALLNNAKTLLLDEPTVGLDPLLTSQIWDYLYMTTRNENRTVIITTHYIDEARHSDKIGFMRDGRILEEGEPNALMDQYGCTNLEDVFIFLCKAQSSDQTIFNPVEPQTKRTSKDDTKSTYNYKTELFNFHRFKAHVYKDFLWIKRNILLLLILLFLPIYIPLLFCRIFGTYPNDLKIGLATEEIAFATNDNICSPHKYVRYGNADQYFNNCSLPQSLSCQYYQKLKKKFDVVVYDNVEDAVRDARENKIWGVLELSSNFTEALMARINDGREVADVDILEAQVGSHLDMSNFLFGYHMQKHARQALIEILAVTAISCGAQGRVATPPLQIVEEFYKGSERIGSGLEASCFMVAFTLYITITYTSSALVNKAVDLRNRNKVIGVTFLEVVAGTLVIQYLMLIVQNGSILFIFYVPFDYTFNGSLILVILGLFLVESVGVSIGILYSKIFSSNVPMTSGTLFVGLCVTFLGGCLWPEEALHWSLGSIKWLFPTQPVVKSLSNIIIKDFGITHPSVYIGYLSCVLWVAIFISLTYVISKFTSN